MEDEKFSTLARAFFGRRNHDLRDVPTAIEIESDDCLLRAVPHPQDKQYLILSVHFLAADRRQSFFTAGALELMHKMNANAYLVSDWRFVISLESEPYFVTHISLDQLDLAEFESAVQKGLNHAGAMLALTSFDWSDRPPVQPDVGSDVTVIRG